MVPSHRSFDPLKPVLGAPVEDRYVVGAPDPEGTHVRKLLEEFLEHVGRVVGQIIDAPFEARHVVQRLTLEVPVLLYWIAEIEFTGDAFGDLGLVRLPVVIKSKAARIS